MPGGAVVPDRDGAGLPFDAALEFLALAVLIEIHDERAAFLRRPAFEMGHEGAVDVEQLAARDGAAVASLYGVQNKLTCRADFFAMMERLAPGFEPHPINGEFLDIIQSGRAAPNVPRFLHRALARGAVSILPPLIRERLQLGRDYDLTLADRLSIKLIARLAERKHDPDSPPAQASVRMGLPSDFLYRKPAEQARLLEEAALMTIVAEAA
jgi:hypothetical protein